MSNFKLIRMTVGMVMTNCYIGYNEDTREAFIVDPGDDARRISQTVREEKLNVKGILLTHGHFDHIMAVPELKAEFGAPVYAHEAEERLLKDTQMNLSAPWVGRALSLEAERLVKDGEKFELAGFEIQAVHTPGHTAGGVSYYLEAEGVLFSGDTLFRGSYGRVDLPTASGAEIARSICEKLLPLPEETAVYPGHERETTIASERKYNPLSRGF